MEEQRNVAKYKEWAKKHPVSLEDMFDDIPKFIDKLHRFGEAPQAIAKCVETRIKTACEIAPAADHDSGDGLTPVGLRMEMKCSLDFKNEGSINWIRIRPHQQLDYYMLMRFVYEPVDMTLYWVPATVVYHLGNDFEFFSKASSTGTPKSNKENKNAEKQIRLKKNLSYLQRQGWDWLENHKIKTSEDLWISLRSTTGLAIPKPEPHKMDQALFDWGDESVLAAS